MELSRLGKTLSMPAGVLLIIFFFLPWLELKCDPSGMPTEGNTSGGPPPSMSMKIGEASGWQLANGEMSVEAQPKPGQDKQQMDADDIEARPIYFLGLVLPVLLIGVGFLALKSDDKKWPMAIAIIGIAGALMSFMAMTTEYADDMEPKGSPSGGEANEMMEAMAKEMTGQMSEALVTECRYGLYFTLLLYMAATGMGLLAVPGPAGTRADDSETDTGSLSSPIPPAGGPPQPPPPAPPPGQDGGTEA